MGFEAKKKKEKKRWWPVEQPATAMEIPHLALLRDQGPQFVFVIEAYVFSLLSLVRKPQNSQVVGVPVGIGDEGFLIRASTSPNRDLTPSRIAFSICWSILASSWRRSAKSSTLASVKL